MRIRARACDLRACVRVCAFILLVSVNFTFSKIGVHSRSDAERVSDSWLLAGLHQMGAVALRPRFTSVAVPFASYKWSSA